MLDVESSVVSERVEKCACASVAACAGKTVPLPRGARENARPNCPCRERRVERAAKPSAALEGDRVAVSSSVENTEEFEPLPLPMRAEWVWRALAATPALLREASTLLLGLHRADGVVEVVEHVEKREQSCSGKLAADGRLFEVG